MSALAGWFFGIPARLRSRLPEPVHSSKGGYLYDIAVETRRFAERIEIVVFVHSETKPYQATGSSN